ncbi:UNVERIFIED_CONTAM: Nuclear pore complex protein A [Sesamum latifolium]|uniref:Nucleoporin autopeptidase n=1 Tax=Sesamum latifolium TaxID=2727402 RepID=A0AAW2X3E2_9LAMI
MLQFDSKSPFGPSLCVPKVIEFHLLFSLSSSNSQLFHYATLFIARSRRAAAAGGGSAAVSGTLLEAFGQSSSSPFGSQPVFGQTNNATSNPFAPKPFGSTSSPFGSQTGGSIFGSMSTGVFGAQSSSPLGSTSVFGASSSPAFGSSTPTFGAASGSAFGNSSSAFGGSSVFGQKPAFGGFGSSTTQTSPFGSSFQQSQPAFGSNLFGSSTPFGQPSQPTFGSSSSPAFGAPSTPAFGATSTPAFGSTASPTFGSTGVGFGVSSSPFGSTTPAFGAASTPAFGASSTPAFGATSSPAFGATSTPAFGATTTPAFGASATPAFGASSTPSFNFGSSPAFGQSTSAFGSSPFGTASSFGAQSSSFDCFWRATRGSRVAPYSPTPETDGATGTQPAGKLESISAMPVYKDKSHEELRWEDYQLGDKGGPAPAGQATAAVGFGGSGFGSSSTPAFGQSSANPFSSTTSSNPFAPKTPVFSSPGFGSSSTSAFGSSPFGTSNTSNPFGSTSSTSSALFGNTTQAFGVNTSPSLFSSSSTSAFGSPSIFGATATQGTASAFGTGLGFGNTQSSPLFQSTTPTLAQTSSPFGQTSSAFGQTAPGFGQSNLFSTPSTGFGGNLFSSTSSLLSNTNTLGFGQTTPSLATPFQSAQPAQSSGGFSFSNFGQSQAGTGGFGGTPGMFSNNAFGQPLDVFPSADIFMTSNVRPNLHKFHYWRFDVYIVENKYRLPRSLIVLKSGTQSSMVAPQAAPITNPFGTLPAMPQMSIGRTGTSPSIQYGISSLPVVEKPVPVRISSLLTSRHLSQRRIRLPVRKYHPKADGPKVPFFNDDDETPSTPKADALFVPRENPRALVIRPLEQWPSRSSAEKTKASSTPIRENGKVRQDVYNSINGHGSKDKDVVHTEDSFENGLTKEQVNPTKGNHKANGVHDGLSTEKGDSYITLTGHRAGEAAIVYEHGADIEALMPKLRHSDYFTEPRIQELAAKERAEPGFCRHVKDFVVGRHGYGSIKFFGETDVRRLDLESLIQFNNREVIVYMDESKKPPVGQGLNKPAEVTLLNIKCFDKKTGQQYTEGPRIDKYKEMLKRKAEDQGAEFVSYDPVKGEWKFRVNHFSKYKLGDEDETEEIQPGSLS